MMQRTCFPRLAWKMLNITEEISLWKALKQLWTLLVCGNNQVSVVFQKKLLTVDIQTIQSIVGHADTEMTEHYLHVQESIRQSAIQLFNEAFQPENWTERHELLRASFSNRWHQRWLAYHSS